MLKILTVAAAIGAFAFALSVAGFSVWRSFYQQNHQTSHEASEKETTENSGHAAGNITTKERADEAIASYTLWLMLFTGVLAFVALIQIGFLIRADETASETANAAKDSADVARDAVKLSDKTAERQLRAYVNNVSTIIRNVEVGKVPEVRVEIKNWGQTPAYRVRHIGSYTLAVFPWSGVTSPPPYQSESIIGPGSNAFMLLKGHALAAEHVAGLNDGSLAIYIEGSITYKDAFDHDRFTNYRFWVGGDRGFPPDQAMFTDIRGNDAN
jgi:hypothetical protein